TGSGPPVADDRRHGAPRARPTGARRRRQAQDRARGAGLAAPCAVAPQPLPAGAAPPATGAAEHRAFGALGAFAAITAAASDLRARPRLGRRRAPLRPLRAPLG